jgi:succinylglutamic semialdehyde dehydrogenase
MTIKPKGDLINGKFIRPRNVSAEIVSVDPGDREQLIGRFPSYAQAPEQALAAAHAAMASWAAQPLTTRVEALKRLRAELRNRSEELKTLLSMETGRPQWETHNEVAAMLRELDAVLQFGLASLRPTYEPPGRSRVVFVPRGVIVVLAAYPQPALIMHRDSIAAIAAGCTVVCKPSALTPATGQLYAEIVHEADLPRGVFNLIQGGEDAGEALVTNPLADGILFTGSMDSARRIQDCLAHTPPKMFRALTSGRCAALVLEDAVLDEAAYKIVIGMCLSTGQRGTTTHRVVVAKQVATALQQRIQQLLQQIKIGHASARNTFMGPLINETAQSEYLAHLPGLGGPQARDLVLGGPLTTRQKGAYITPSLKMVPATAMSSMPDPEARGPWLALCVVDRLEEGLRLLQAPPVALVASVFCRSERLLAAAQDALSSGLCLHNLPTTHWPSNLPLCPQGIPAGTFTIRACTRLQVQVSSEGAFDSTMLPPGLPRSLG